MKQPVFSGTTSKWSVLLLFFILAFILFLPVIGKGFASDDFSVLYRVAFKRVFFIRDFFRPLSDISLYSSYLAGGLRPVYFNIVNIAIHAGSAFLLYCFCLTDMVPVAASRKVLFAWLASLLFLIYPFHIEAVCWAIGRGIVLSGFFGMLSLLVVSFKISTVKKYLLSCIFYFISLCGYETTLVLPLIILIFLHVKGSSLRTLLPLAAAYIFTLMLNLVIRLQIAGNLLGSYGSKTIPVSFSETISKFLKALGRLILPPSSYPSVMMVCFAVIALSFIMLGTYMRKRKKDQVRSYVQLASISFISCILPAMFGISTRTYEGDRVFYFSSFFVCLFIAYVLQVINNYKLRAAGSIIAGSYFLVFFYQGILTWRKSGKITDTVIIEVGRIEHPRGKLYLLNIPEEYNGAPVLRNGFTTALLIRHIDTSGVVVVNYSATAFSRKINGLISPVQGNDGIYLYPSAVIGSETIDAKIWTDSHRNDSVHLRYNKEDRIFYWNEKSLVQLR